MIEYIGKFFLKRVISALITKTILKFDISNSSEKVIGFLILRLIDEIEINKKSYEDAIIFLTKEYSYDKKTLLSNPLDNYDVVILGNGKEYFEFVSGVEILIKEEIAKKTSSTKNKFFNFPFFPSRGGGTTSAETTTTVPTVEEVNTVVSENESIFDAFFTSLSEYYESFLSLFDDPTEELLEGESDLSFDAPAKVAPITREELNGAWYILTNSGDKACTYIQSNDTLSLTESNGDKTDLVLTIKGTINNVSAMKLTYNGFSAETINMSEYMTNHTFKGSYSNGETITGEKIKSLAICKSDYLKI